MMIGRVKQAVAEALGIPRSRVQLDSLLREDLGADSLDLVEIAVALEEAFGIEVPDEEMERAHTVRDLVRYVAWAQSTAARQAV